MSRQSLIDAVDENADYLVVDKPGDLVCHPTKEGPTSSLIGRLRLYFEGQDDVEPRFINRLDRETSGLVLISKHRAAHRLLCRAYEQATKVYWGLVQGIPETPEGVIEAALGPDPDSAVRIKQRVVHQGGKPSTTHWRRLCSRDGLSLLELRPQSGRMHQLRVHLAHLGHPLVGDKLYGGDESLYLELVEKGWTRRLEQTLPSRRHMLSALALTVGEHRWKTEPPADFRPFLEELPEVSF